VHGFFAECLIRAPQLVLANPNFVKRVIFPLDVLPWSMILSASFHAVINMLVFAVLHAITAGPPPWTIVLFPVVLVPLAILAAGLAWFLASLGVYLRDINQIMGVVATAMLFLSSAIVPVDALPERYRWLFEINPLTFIIDESRNVALWGVLPDWRGLGVYTLVALATLCLGCRWFRATRAGFADVL
jgi:lipopolysaccharide transport system permease protein